MWGLAPFVSYPFSNTQFRDWYYWVADRACMCVYQSWAISSRDSTSPSRRHTHTPNLARSQTGTRRFVRASHTHDDRAFFLPCLLFLFLSNGHHFLPVFHQNLFGATNFIDAQGKIWPFLFFFFGSGTFSRDSAGNPNRSQGGSAQRHSGRPKCFSIFLLFAHRADLERETWAEVPAGKQGIACLGPGLWRSKIDDLILFFPFFWS
jgi:hypothetical protein